ncbi:MAG: GNAT family N-acetyltransferase [Gemmatimonadales bacterium]
MAPDVRHDERNGRFSLELSGTEAFLVYREAGEKTLEYLSTYVPPEHRERGLGEQLVLAALDYARGRGFQIIPTCWFVSRVMESHPEYRSLAAG